MKKFTIKRILLSINFIFILMFAVSSFISMHTISGNMDGLIKGFYQYKSLSDTVFILKEIELKQEKDPTLHIDQANASFARFMGGRSDNNRCRR